jgi:protein involved in polysaccharide export with SLBB domain
LPLPPRVARTWNETLPGLARDEHPADQIRVGDRIVVAVSDQRGTVERTAWVEGNGKAHIAGGQDVSIAGASLQEAESRIAAAVRAKDKFALVDVRLGDNVARQALVLGAVTRPGGAVIQPAMRVSGLIASQGGLVQPETESGALVTSPADLSRARLLRNGVALPIDLERALLGEPGHDVLIHPGDFVYIPYASANGIAVLGMVGGPGIVSHRSRMRVTETLGAAGGILSLGDKKDVRIVRGPVDTPVAYRMSLTAIADQEGRDAHVLPGDVVFVEDKAIEDLGEVLGLLAPLASFATSALVTTFILMQ